MKRKLLLIVMALCCCATSIAKEFTSEQLKLRNEIKTFLSEEGFMPTVDSDGDIKFKKEGRTYYVIISEYDKSPMCVSLSRYLEKPDDYSDIAIKLALSELNAYRGVKARLIDNAIIYKSEMYLTSSEAFKYVFYKCMNQIGFAESDLEKELSKVKY